MISCAARHLANIGDSKVGFQFSAEETAFVTEIESLARSIVAKKAADHDADAYFDMELWRALAEYGLTGMGVPTEYGGAGGGTLLTCLALEALQRGGGSSGLTFALAAHLAICTLPIMQFGTDEQRRRYLPRLCAGEWIGGYAATEPSAGADGAAIETIARKVDGGFELSGYKTFVSNGPVADVLIVLARTSSGAMPFGLGLSCFIVEPRKNPGVVVEPKLDTAGYRSCQVANIRLERVYVSESQLLGSVGRAFHTISSKCLDWERSIMVAPVVGEMQRTFNSCVGYSLERKVRQQPLASLQMIQSKIADMRAQLEGARWAVYRAAWLQDRELPHELEGPLAKHMAADAAMHNAIDAMQIFGGLGYLRGSPVERTLRDAKFAAIGGGTQELQKMAIAAASFKEFSVGAAGVAGADGLGRE
jgi:alkylation response protein AidB-like acyl-CoA dehydrogenase